MQWSPCLACRTECWSPRRLDETWESPSARNCAASEPRRRHTPAQGAGHLLGNVSRRPLLRSQAGERHLHLVTNNHNHKRCATVGLWLSSTRRRYRRYQSGSSTAATMQRGGASTRSKGAWAMDMGVGTRASIGFGFCKRSLTVLTTLTQLRSRSTFQRSARRRSRFQRKEQCSADPRPISTGLLGRTSPSAIRG